MSNFTMYKDYAHTIRKRLMDDVNGYVKFEVVTEGDLIIFHINFKEFEFRYVITDVSASIYHGTTDEVVESIERKYRHAIMDAFFRTEKNKEKRLERRRLGIPDEEVAV